VLVCLRDHFTYNNNNNDDNMPARAADLDEALQKKGGLTLSQLANYDDLITDALVDRVSRLALVPKLL
jgi:histone-lysine N-methyltransferase SUV420H